MGKYHNGIIDKRLKIGVDVDGVLAGFVPAARRVCQQLFNGRPDDSLVQTSWSFSSLGILDEEMVKMYETIDTIPDWWLTLEKMPGTDLVQKLCATHNVFFITNRKQGAGSPIEWQTARWLQGEFGMDYPQVIVTNEKGPIVSALKLDYFLDDRPKNIEEAHKASPATTNVLLRTTYNHDFRWITEVSAFDDFVMGVI